MKLFGSTFTTDSLVVERNPRGLTRETAAANVKAAARPPEGVKVAAPIANVPIPGVRWREQNTTLITYLFLDPELNLVERNEAAHRYADSLPPPASGSTRGVTGSGPARLAQFEAIDDVLPWIEVATIAVILIVVALYFRSLGAPLVTLACAGLAYVIAVRVLAWSGERGGRDRAERDRAGAGGAAARARHRLHGVLHVRDAAAPAAGDVAAPGRARGDGADRAARADRRAAGRRRARCRCWPARCSSSACSARRWRSRRWW